ncbi:MAG: DUF4102 domain-containing protein [Alphaproteobacteria bacterium]|nr:DUF4102 domain-containing protein [Alphaproteobacteria bacterium]OJV46329.1 MAG: hypothetical protein BGO28_03115 [Alphaproteobacteria bacterium 43-37]
MRVKLTKKLIDASSPALRREKLVLWDSSLRGFGIVIRSSGKKTYCIQYRDARNALKRLSIGEHGLITLDEARLAAQKLLSQYKSGELVEARVKNNIFFDQLAESYLNKHSLQYKRDKSVLEDKRLINQFLLVTLRLRIRD